MSFFKQYDMRGTFGADFDLATVYRVGRALPRVIGGRRWLIGRDCRLTSEPMRDALVKGLVESGAEVTDLGPCTTSMVYFFTGEDGFDGSVMITASHNPPSDNGLKVSRRTALPVSYVSGLAEVEKLVLADTATPPAELPAVAVVSEPYRARYRELMAAKIAGGPDLGSLRFAVDCSNGMASLFARELFPNAVIINETRDGRFPAHSPNPLKPESRVQLGEVVRAEGLDCGVIFDGDADRAMFVDDHGEFVQPDYLIPAVARTSGATAGDRVLHDIRTSRGAIEAIREMGCEPVAVPVGPAFAKPKMRELNSPAGGELAGHYYFREFHGCDSGLLAAIRILGEAASAKARGLSFSQMMAPVMTRYRNSGELNYRVEDKDGAIRRVLTAAKAFGTEIASSDIDGFRLDYADGWFNVRKSNTEPFLRLLVECRAPEMLADWIRTLETAICAE